MCDPQEDVARVVRTTKAGSVSVKPDGRAIRYTDNSVIVGDLASLRGDEEVRAILKKTLAAGLYN